MMLPFNLWETDDKDSSRLTQVSGAVVWASVLREDFELAEIFHPSHGSLEARDIDAQTFG
jgi:hypothetical protein